MAENMILEVKIPDIEKVKKHLKGMPDKATVAMYRAINKTIDTIKGYIVDDVVEKRYKVKKGAVKKTLSTQKASKRKLSGLVKSYADSRIPLKGFDVSPAKSGTKPSFYKSRVMLDHKLAGLTGNSEFSKGFIATMPSGHIGVFERRLGIKNGSGKEKIKELYGPSVPSMIKSPQSFNMIRDKGQDYLRSRINHENQYLLGGGK